jgi:hypothetical protein
MDELGQVPEEPPADAEEWTDEQWLAWLVATDDEPPAPPASPLNRVTRSSGGFVLGQAMLGMAQAIYGRKDDHVVIVAEGKGEPDDEEDFTVHLDPDHPERSYVQFRDRRETLD